MRTFAIWNPHKSVLWFLCVAVGAIGPNLVGAQPDELPCYSSYEILVRLFDATRGLYWEDHSGWLESEQFCNWKGIKCYETDELNGQIQMLDLSSNHLVGTLPPEVFELPYVQDLLLNDNPDLVVSIGKVGGRMKQLMLDSTTITSLNGIGAATGLERLHMIKSQLTGPIPTELFDLSSLTGLFANYNSFNGTIPTLIGLLTNLEQVYLYNNELTGQLPTEFGNLKSLKVLSLTDNNFSGTLPYQLGHMSSIERLAINQVEKEPGISGTMPKFNNVEHLTELYLQNQLLTGTISSDFLIKAPKDEIIKLDLRNNMLSGSLPVDWLQFTNMSPMLENNMIDDIDESLCANEWFDGGDCPDMIMCPPGTYSTEGRSTASDPCVTCNSSLYFGATLCTDEDSTADSERAILEHLYNEMGGEDWMEDKGWLVEDNVCDWYGIDCTDEGKVQGIDLKNNGVANGVPTEVYSLPYLSQLTLTSNNLDFSFKGISKATNLQTLQLSNVNLKSLNGIEELGQTKISKLNLGTNALTGELPLSLLTLSTLENLNLANNKFTGRLPPLISSLKANLKDLTVYGCSFDNTLPTELGMLTKLERLDLSENRFTGSIPTQLEQLTLLQSLSIHQTTADEGLSGGLLAFSGLKRLTSLHLESNDLTGSLPSNFLGNTQVGDSRIEVRLTDNKINGATPGSWAERFSNLFVEITGNSIVGLAGSWCDQVDWMDGAVSEGGCDAILCRVGTYNEYGRSTSTSNKCRECPAGSQMNVLGARECQSGEVVDPSGDILSEFYHATGGDSWLNKTGWLQTSDQCSGWFGIQCDRDGNVAVIDLHENNLAGSMPSSIYKLPLSRLELRGNHELDFTFEGIEQATNLVYMGLHDINLETISGISKVSNLQEIHLSKNKMTGTLPDELFALTQLTYLNLDYNRYSGRIPSDISQLSNLEKLLLVENKISGQIPAAIGSLTNLKELFFTGNRLSGTLPGELERLSSLETLYLENENPSNLLGGEDGKVVGPVMSDSAQVRSGLRGPLLSFATNPNLKALFLSQNSFTGTIPFDFLNGLTDLTTEIFVDLKQNELTGTVPASLTQFDKMYISLAGNQFSDVAPGVCKKEAWQQGYVKDVGCDAILCPPGTYNEYGMASRNIDGKVPCNDCNVEGAAQFYGSMVCSTPGQVQDTIERDVLKELFDALGGYDWDINTNWVDESSSICSWFGITCVADDEESVESIQLPSNGLNGTIPSSIFTLSNLTEIDFSGNTVEISFSTAGSTPTSITYINLDSTGLESLSGVADVAPQTELLHIQGNRLESLPSEILNLSSLKALFIDDNDFSSTFPALETLTQLRSLSAGSCGFTGPLPTTLGLLTGLEFLSVFDNSFTGSIPTELLGLTNLKSLNLSFQKSAGGDGFSGALPDFAAFTKLSELYLSWNSLAGSIPSTFLSTADNGAMFTLDLRYNSLTGAIPSELSRFGTMQILLAANMIDTIPDALCSLTWNEFNTSTTGCDHVLCNKGTFNDLGYASGVDLCMVCNEGNGTEYYGSTSCGGDLEKTVLSRLYVDLNGKDWTKDDGWVIGDDVCEWYGITCYRGGAKDGHIKEIKLTDNNLVGAVPSDIFKIQYLESIELNSNRVRFSFEGIGTATNLINLHLSATPMESLTGIGNATSLQYLHLTECNMTGPIPDEIFSLSSLRALFLNFNDFDGILSDKVGQLTSLEELYLFNNELTGSIPTSIGRLSNARVIGLGQNQLDGTLPTELNLLTGLEIFSVQINRGLTGPILPFNVFPSLSELYLGMNSFSSTIPVNFLSGVNNVTSTLKIDLSNNELVGSIPTELTRFNDLRLFLGGNMIDEVPEELCSKSEWMGGLMSEGCDALLCLPGTFSENGRRVSDDEPCQPCAFNSSSFFYGSQTCSPQKGDQLDERSILFQLYHALDGNNWKNRDNWLEDNQSICKWHGVHCATEVNVAGEETVLRLELPSNDLAGTIPGVIYHLSSLQVLNVRDNAVSLSFQGADATSTLQELDLYKTKMSTLKGIGQIESLRKLHLNDNDFSGGTLPDDVFDLTNLELLDVSNSAFGGTLSSLIGRLKSLTQLYGHKNDFSGTLPTSLGLLSNLEVLQFSENTFVGTLPTEMEQMVALKSIYLDTFLRNGAGVTGPLLSFSNMPQLSELYLGSNTLTGTIPADFLSGNTAEEVNVGLEGNQLTGIVPSSLSRINKLNIDLTDNMFEEINDSLCDKRRWMSGTVNLFSCAAIMCPIGTFNKYGRQSSNEDPCIPCTGSNITTYMGSVNCLSLQWKKEREALELLYQVTNGAGWKENDNWMDDNVDICKWLGITCREDMTVEAIRLGGNDLSGKIPVQIFDLTNLKFLWLYSNPIDFSFDGIDNAKKLTSILLDSTNLKSLTGIGNAASLTDIDVRFNSLTGKLPEDEIKNLRELQSFTIGNNLLSGTIPSFGSNRKLRTLRLGNNKFTGTVPSLSAHPELFALDLSDNLLTGTIPDTLLESLQTTSKPEIDLSSNQLTGTVPGEFAERFPDLTIYLRDNKITGIDNALCSALTFNHGDVHDFGCDAILCPPKTYALATGRASTESATECTDCSEAEYYGTSTCSNGYSQYQNLWLISTMIFGCMIVLM